MRRAVFAAACLWIAGTAQAQESTGIKAYSKFDFVPGATIIAY